ncbi:MAG TPA: diadenylate cyclase CdaA [Candidatus Polarisedimenticolaceae bacterium]|nr:diadenylate cyclase CdaA [Candidatus Polarisedimenticolaceae bacterium]
MLSRLITALHLRDLDAGAVIDILVLAFIIYQLLSLIRGTRAVQIVIGVVAVVLVHFMTGPGLVSLPAVHSILGDLLLYIPFALIVLFQNPIRQAFARFGRNPLTVLLPRRQHERLAEEVSLAAISLASKRLGALIVIERELGLRTFYETGIQLDSLVSYDLLMNVFIKGSPLHDGAAIVAEGRIKAASCYLPLTVDPSLSRTFGTRHRAAIGITEESDALAVVVSEERGIVSLAEGGEIVEGLTAQHLAERLREALAPRAEGRVEPRRRAHELARTRDV